MSAERFELVIIDDSVHFAFHVWRYLGRSIGIGGGSGLPAGDSPPSLHDKQLRDLFWTNEGTIPKELLTANGRVAVWWVPGDHTVLTRLDELLESRLKNNRHVFFLVDMRGQPASTFSGKERERSELMLGSDGEGLGREAVKWIIKKRFPKNPQEVERVIMVVSSYETGSLPVEGVRTPLRIWPKSPDTLERLWRRVPSAPELRVTTPGFRCLHILVTGAGFEIRDDQTGCFGLPSTAELLLEMGYPFGEPGKLLRRRPEEEKGLPAFEPNTEDSFFYDFDQLAQTGDLDAWWSHLLEHELQRLVSKRAQIEDRIRMKKRASMREWDLREAFRRVILRYDWGHLNQSLDAVKLGWASWLTTNYTRFADRAIELVQADRDRNRLNGSGGTPELRPLWRVVSTSIEALMLSREVLHGSGGLDSGEGEKYRYLFKLHGDIAHLHTMATAGHDKELYSPLSVPVDSLHQVYATAEDYLRHQLETSGPDVRLVWHIVGHGLQDWLLLCLITEVCRSNGDWPVDFLVVNKEPKKVAERLCRFLGQHRPALKKRVVPLEQKATDYLARIARSGALREPDGDEWAETWFRDLGLA